MNPIHELKKGQSARRILDGVLRRDRAALLPHLKGMVNLIDTMGHVPSVKRNVIRLLSLIDIPSNLRGPVFDKASKLLSDHSEAIAVKVFAMTVMANIAMKEPDLKNEVIIAIEEQLPYGSAAFKNRGARLLKELKR